MRRCQSADGLRTDQHGWTLPPWAIDERLANLAVYGGNDNDARRTAHLMIRMWRGKDGVLRQLTEEVLQDSLDNLLVFLARFMHQSMDSLERRSMDELHRWYAIVAEIVMAQSGKAPPTED